jgi:hypothetical protein
MFLGAETAGRIAAFGLCADNTQPAHENKALNTLNKEG